MKAVVLCTLLVLVLSGPSAPVWPNRWQAAFTEIHMDNTSFFINGTTTGLYSYDYPNNVTRLDRADGSQDPLCSTTVPGRTPCSQIVTGGNRYLYFAEKNSCCICCVESEGCGVLSPNWAQNSVYLQTLTGPNGESLNEWTNDDDGRAYYVERASDHAPYQIFRTPNKDILLFHLNTYQQSFSSQIFQLPPVCKNAQMCQAPSVCARFRQQEPLEEILL
jgi:hypothetical protein